jgi:hypothetical protein
VIDTLIWITGYNFFIWITGYTFFDRYKYEMNMRCHLESGNDGANIFSRKKAAHTMLTEEFPIALFG